MVVKPFLANLQRCKFSSNHFNVTGRLILLFAVTGLTNTADLVLNQITLLTIYNNYAYKKAENSSCSLAENSENGEQRKTKISYYSYKFQIFMIFFMPRQFQSGWGHIVSPQSVQTYVRTSVRPVRKMVSVRYLLKRLEYWIHILYTGI